MRKMEDKNNNDKGAAQGEFNQLRTKRHALRRQSSKVTKLDIEDTYNLLDRSPAGAVSPPVLQESFRNIGLPVTSAESYTIYKEVTEDGSQEFDEDALENWVEKNCPEIEPEDISEGAFGVLDRDGDGYLTFEDLKRGLPPLGINLSDSVLRVMFDEADTDKDGKLTLTDFLQAIDPS